MDDPNDFPGSELPDGPPQAAPPPDPIAERYSPEREPVTLMDKAKLPLMISLLVFIVGILAVGQFGGVSLVTKKDFGANIALMNTAIGEAKGLATEIASSVEADIAGIPSSVNTAVATSTAGIDAKIAASTTGVDTKIATAVSTKADQANLLTANVAIADAATKVASANAEITALKEQSVIDQATIATLGINVTAIQARIANLETAAVETPTTPSSAITVDVSTMGYALLPTTAANTTLTTSFRVDLTNTTDTKIEDLVISIITSTNVPQASVTSWSLSGGGTAWQSSGLWYAGTIEFMNTQWGLNIDAGSTKRLYLTLNVLGTFPNPNYQYQVDVEVLD